MKRSHLLFLLIVPVISSRAENFILNGHLISHIEYRMDQSIVPAPGTRLLVLSYVEPPDFDSPSYRQSIDQFHLSFSTDPARIEKVRDNRGNSVITATWIGPPDQIRATVSFLAANRTRLQPLVTSARFPPKRLPADVVVYLQPTSQVPSDDAAIIRRAKALTKNAATEFDAVQKILTWIVDYIRYELRPDAYGAAYALETGLGNCQNYSHLTAALMRAVGIPVRIVNGITLKEAYHARTGKGILTMRMAQGRHSWIEVYFPDLGWIPFDPQQMQLFVSNRFIRIEVGLDNNETVADGCVRWRQSSGYTGMPVFHESIRASFSTDEVRLTADRQNYGPRKILFTPAVEAEFSALFFREASEAPAVFTAEVPGGVDLPMPVMFGNLDFPEDIDFLETRSPGESPADSLRMLTRNFLVETAEYVTSGGQQYAQTFLVDRPVMIHQTGLALHKFGGHGQLWVELLRDDGTGRPGEAVAVTQLKPLSQISAAAGYRWEDFDFDTPVRLEPGRYWLVLAYTGSPVVNWFFSYGKPVGPSDGTRYKVLFDEDWDRILNYEFNYRIIGSTGM